MTTKERQRSRQQPAPPACGHSRRSASHPRGPSETRAVAQTTLRPHRHDQWATVRTYSGPVSHPLRADETGSASRARV